MKRWIGAFAILCLMLLGAQATLAAPGQASDEAERDAAIARAREAIEFDFGPATLASGDAYFTPAGDPAAYAIEFRTKKNQQLVAALVETPEGEAPRMLLAWRGAAKHHDAQVLASARQKVLEGLNVGVGQPRWFYWTGPGGLWAQYEARHPRTGSPIVCNLFDLRVSSLSELQRPVAGAANGPARQHLTNPSVHRYLAEQALSFWPPSNQASAAKEFNQFRTQILYGATGADDNGNQFSHYWNADGGYQAGTTGYQSAIAQAQKLYDQALAEYKKSRANAYINLGRVAHILGDLTVPSRVLPEADWGARLDYAERWAAGPNNSLSNIKNIPLSGVRVTTDVSKLTLNPAGSKDYNTAPAAQRTNLLRLFLNTAEVTDNYDSDVAAGETQGGTMQGYGFRLSQRTAPILKVQLEQGANGGGIIEDVPRQLWGEAGAEGTRMIVVNKAYLNNSANRNALRVNYGTTTTTRLRGRTVAATSATTATTTTPPTWAPDVFDVRGSISAPTMLSDTAQTSNARTLVPLAVGNTAALYKLFWNELQTQIVPQVTSFRINGGDSGTSSTRVILNNTATGNPTHYKASQRPDFRGVKWLPYSQSPVFNLTPSNGRKTIYFKVRTATQVSADTRDTITLGNAGIPAGVWKVTYRWTGQNKNRGANWYVTRDGKFATSDGYSGEWTMSGNSIRFTYSSGPAYQGTVNSLTRMSGSMAVENGNNGSWRAEKLTNTWETWNLNYLWNGRTWGKTIWYLHGNKSLRTREGLTGTWSRSGNRLTVRYREGAVYSGTVDSIGTTARGTMRSSSKKKGQWNAVRTADITTTTSLSQ